MCGLVVCSNARLASDADAVHNAAERLDHRGPDGSGLHTIGRVVLAHRRLSIIDVAGGRQPLLSEGEDVALACNGEIYNYHVLRADLEKRHRFRSRTDSEVIVHLYEEMGEDCVKALDGMFAFVVTDGSRLLAARDPLGIKPLYMGRDGEGRAWFASELKALVGVCDSIEEIPPGHLFTPEGGIRRWFDAPWIKPLEDPAPFDGPVLAGALGRAVEKRLMSDVPLGVFLSGGLDSSLIAALMRPHIDDLHSFAVGIEGATDLEAARQVAKHLGTHHHEHLYTRAEATAVLETVMAHLESYDAALIESAVPCFFVSRLAAEHVKVVLSGEGADEAFAGYRYLRTADDAEALHAESIRLLSGLHNLNLQRVDRMTMAHGLEGRVPFLDIEFLGHAMALDPHLKLHRPNRPEKWALRAAFTGVLPDAILWRTKEEFAEGSGADRVLQDYCAERVSDSELREAARRFPEDTPKTKAAYHYRQIFDRMFPGEAARRSVGRWRPTLTSAEEAQVACTR